jgi:hypothetical protein
MLMSGAEGKSDKEPDEIGAGPTRSFEGLVKGPGSRIWRFIVERELNRSEVVVHWTNRTIRSFDFLNVNDYSTAF